MPRRKTANEQLVEHDGTYVTVKIMDDGSVYILSRHLWQITNMRVGGKTGTSIFMTRVGRQ